MKISDYHDAQASHHAAIHGDPAYAAKSAAWQDPETTDYWRHDRMRRAVAPLLQGSSSWLTVGDGRYGADAAWLIREGQQPLATDIQDRTLAAGAEAGFIADYRVENAESLSFDSDSFDWVLCKESYHHMPRAPLAFYEMLRVARKGVVLIEPIDPEPTRWWGRFAIAILGLARPKRHAFEPSGNYLYSLSRREVEKMMLGMGLRIYAFRQLSDHYEAGAECERGGNGPIRQRIQRRIAWSDMLKGFAGVSSQLGVFIVFKSEASVPPDLAASGLELVLLPENPYQPSGDAA